MWRGLSHDAFPKSILDALIMHAWRMKTHRSSRWTGVSNVSLWLAYSMYEDRGTPIVPGRRWLLGAITASGRLRRYLAGSTMIDTAKPHRSNHIWGMDQIDDLGENAGVASTFTKSVNRSRIARAAQGGGLAGAGGCLDFAGRKFPASVKRGHMKRHCSLGAWEKQMARDRRMFDGPSNGPRNPEQASITSDTWRGAPNLWKDPTAFFDQSKVEKVAGTARAVGSYLPLKLSAIHEHICTTWNA